MPAAVRVYVPLVETLVALTVPPDWLVAVVAVAALPVVFWFSVGNVQFAKFPDVGVPKIGDVSVGLVDSTLLPEPVEVVTPVPPDVTAKVADNPAAVPVVFWFRVGTSAATIARKPGAPAVPFGAARK